LLEFSLFQRINVVLFSNNHLGGLLGKIMVIPIKFERVQWPVGHGGFHTGQLRVENADFKYFYDCGALETDGMQLIRKKFKSTNFDFGVISHFDKDHVSELENAKVDFLFLPYMTLTDMVLHALIDMFEKSMEPSEAFKSFTVIKKLQREGTHIIMVNGPTKDTNDKVESELPSAPPKKDKQTDLILNIPSIFKTADGYYSIQHKEAVEVLHDNLPILVFKFFNHRKSDVFAQFEKAIQLSVKNKKLNRPQALPATKQNLEPIPYITLDDFLKDIKSGNVQSIGENIAELKSIYNETLKKNREKNITIPNLSSLNMFGRTADFRHHPHITWIKTFADTSSFVNPIDRDEDGWMLTGDLELTETIWPGFQDHYFHDISKCSVLNVPHHASKFSLCDEATAFMRNNIFVMPVKSNDPKHPALILRDRLDRHHVQKRQCVTSVSESGISFTTIACLRKFHP
jgi:hypothetical protein